MLSEFVAGEQAEEYLETGSLLVSELVTNAVDHADSDKALDVDLALTEKSLEIRVRDYGAGEPRITSAKRRQLGGRGLLLVDRLAEEWGVQRMEPTGKVVWCRIAGDSRNTARPPRSVRSGAGTKRPGPGRSPAGLDRP